MMNSPGKKTKEEGGFCGGEVVSQPPQLVRQAQSAVPLTPALKHSDTFHETPLVDQQYKLKRSNSQNKNDFFANMYAPNLLEDNDLHYQRAAPPL